MPKSRGGSELSHKPTMLRQAPRSATLPKMPNPDVNASIPNQRRSSRAPILERKKGAKTGNLETKLGHVQDELRKLKEQLISTKDAKRDAQQELEQAKKMITPPGEHGDKKEERSKTGVMEARLTEMEKALKGYADENEGLRRRLEEAAAKAAAAWTREEEMALRMVRVTEELAEAQARSVQLEQQLVESNGIKSSLEAEMGKLKVQIEQWRKAADVAVSALADQEGNGSRRSSGVLGLGDLWKKKGQN
ncbi:interactor of constitutive active ROPs 4-like [Wolffia australiana]